MSFVAVQIGVTVDHSVPRGKVLHLESGVAVFVEIAFFNEIVVSLIVSISCTRFALNEQSVVTGICDVDAIEVPIGGTKAYALLRIIGMFVVRHGREVKNSASIDSFQGDELVWFTTVADVNTRIVDIRTSLHTDGIARSDQPNGLFQREERMRLGTVGSSIVTVRGAPECVNDTVVLSRVGVSLLFCVVRIDSDIVNIAVV